MIKVKTIDNRTISFDQKFDIEDSVYMVTDPECYPMIVTDYVVGSVGIRYLCKGAGVDDFGRIFDAIEISKEKPVFDKEDDLEL